MTETKIPRKIWEGLDLDRIRAKRALKQKALGIKDADTEGINGIINQVDKHHKAIEDMVVKFAQDYARLLYSQGMYDAGTASHRSLILAEYMLNEIQSSVDDMFEDILGKASNERKVSDGLEAAVKLKDVEYSGSDGIKKPKTKRNPRHD